MVEQKSNDSIRNTVAGNGQRVLAEGSRGCVCVTHVSVDHCMQAQMSCWIPLMKITDSASGSAVTVDWANGGEDFFSFATTSGGEYVLTGGAYSPVHDDGAD